MRKIVLGFLLICSAGFYSCGSKQMTEEEVNKLVDSMAAAQIEDISAKATQDCEARMATEVGKISDSILKSYK